MTFAWDTCSSELKEFVFDSLAKIRFIVDGPIIGCYLHGSLAMGGFNLKSSDIDLIIVTEQPIALEKQRELACFFLDRSNKPFPIEISFLNASQLNSWQFPTPYDFHYSEFWRKRYEKELAEGTTLFLNNREKTDIDLAAHFTILHHYGICLEGKPIEQTFPPVPETDYLASILDDYEDCLEKIHQDPVYCILNLIRVYQYLKAGEISSKKKAGIWGILNLPKRFRTIIRQATEVYETEKSAAVFKVDDLNIIRDYFKRSIEEEVRSVRENP